MFVVKNDGSICITRGDIAAIEVRMVTDTGAEHMFTKGDVVRFNVHERQRTDRVVILKDVLVEEDTPAVVITLGSEDTKIGELINAPVNYWYEIELNPDTLPQTIVGYNEVGPKLFRLFPEGDDEKWVL